MNKGFRMKTIDEIRNDVIEKLNQNEMISKKHKKVFLTLHLLILASRVTESVSISPFAPLVAVGLKNLCIITGIKKYKLMMKKTII